MYFKERGEGGGGWRGVRDRLGGVSDQKLLSSLRLQRTQPSTAANWSDYKLTAASCQERT